MSKGDRHNKGKLRWRNFPLFLFRPVVEVADAAELREGNPTGKYETFNFLKGLDALDTLDCLMRHLDKFIDPNEPDLDPEDGKHHLAKVAWNALVLLYHIQTRPELDTRWKPEKELTPAERVQVAMDMYNAVTEEGQRAFTDEECREELLGDKIKVQIDPNLKEGEVRLRSGGFTDSKSEYQEMAEKIYMANLAGVKIGESNE